MPVYIYPSPIGKLGIAEEAGSITHIYFEGESAQHNLSSEETPLIKEAIRQLDLYFKGELRDFDLPLAPKGTPYQQAVWQQLCTVPYGSTATYKEIAQKVGKPKGFRSVGQANNRNPIPIIIPCHRIIGADGKLVGYGGGLDIKIKLLELEKRHAK